MSERKYVFSQIASMLPKYEFEKSVDLFNGNYKVQGFTCWSQFLCMIFGQLTGRDSLRDTVTCLSAHKNKLYHLGIKNSVNRSTLAYANETRDWRIYEDFAQKLIGRAVKLYADEKVPELELPHKAYAIDSSTVDLCLSVFWWAPFRKTKAAIKLHTMLDLQGNIPTFIHITDGKTQDVQILDLIPIEANAFYVIDRGYIDFIRFQVINASGAYFITRTKKGMVFERVYSNPTDKAQGIIYDQTVKTINNRYSGHLRRVKYHDKETDKTLIFLTNNFNITAPEVALLYKKRWQIELFFKWIKQHLKIKSFWGQSENAVKLQIWIAICAYLTVAIAKKELKLERSIYEILQIISVSAFDKTPIKQLLNNSNLPNDQSPQNLQLSFNNL